MEKDTFNGPSSVFKGIDIGIQNNIINLDRKLNDMSQEVQAKIATLSENESQHVALVEQLGILAEEIQKARTSISTLVNMAMSEEMTGSEFINANAQRLHELNDIIEKFNHFGVIKNEQ